MKRRLLALSLVLSTLSSCCIFQKDIWDPWPNCPKEEESEDIPGSESGTEEGLDQTREYWRDH